MMLRLYHKNGFYFLRQLKTMFYLAIQRFRNRRLMTQLIGPAYMMTLLRSQTNGAPWLGKKGIMLSGGQQHRLAMARGYASTHHMLILDDVLSSVDHDTEANMIEAMYDHATPPTTVIIAHRVSALSKCDHIIVLDEGKIIQEGSHEDLIQQPGIYQKPHGSTNNWRQD